MKNVPVLIINGCPRSGTSILEIILAKRINATLMPETHFMPHFYPFLFLWGNLSNYNSRKRLLKAIYDFVEIRIAAAGLNVNEISEYCFLGTKDKSGNILVNSNSYSSLIYSLYCEYMQMHSGNIPIEKSAYYRPVRWNILENSITNVKFIHLIRDGRDVAKSWTKTWFGPDSISEAAFLWKEHIRSGQDWSQNNPEKCLTVFYEDMIVNVQSTINKVVEFLNMDDVYGDYNQSSLNWLHLISGSDHMKNVEADIKKDNSQKWVHTMNEEEVKIFEKIAGDTLQEVGYSRAFSDKELANVQSSVKNEKKISIIDSKRKMMTFLPLCIYISNKIHLSLPQAMRKLKFIGSNA